MGKTTIETCGKRFSVNKNRKSHLYINNKPFERIGEFKCSKEEAQEFLKNWKKRNEDLHPEAPIKSSRIKKMTQKTGSYYDIFISYLD